MACFHESIVHELPDSNDYGLIVGRGTGCSVTGGRLPGATSTALVAVLVWANPISFSHADEPLTHD